VGWFSENGGATYEAIVEVIPASSPHEPEHAAPQEPDNAAGGPFEDLIESTYFEPSAFDMYPIPRAEVEALVRDHGAVLLGTDEWVSEWHSFTYYVQVRG
jgi:hypothetical protein